MKVKVTGVVEYTMPDDPIVREAMYGEVDPQKCLQIDKENLGITVFSEFDDVVVTYEFRE